MTKRTEIVAPTLAIARLTIRVAVRSKLVGSMAALLVVLIVALPLSVHGDGSLVSEVRMVVKYTLWAATGPLSAVTLWASCGAVAGEIESRRIRLAAVKPVSRVTFLLGKWLAIGALNALALILVGAIVLITVYGKQRPRRWSAEDRRDLRESVLTARTRYVPPQPDVRAEVERRFRLIVQRSGSLPAGMSECDVMTLLERRILSELSVVMPGRERTYVFRIREESIEREPTVRLRYRLTPSYSETGKAAATWFVGTRSRPEQHSVSVDSFRYGQRTVSLPMPVATDGDNEVVVTFRNGGEDASTAAFFYGANSIELLVGAGGFVPNLTRALAVLWCMLATLAALGLTAGTFFSFPVAAFLATAVMSVTMASGFFAYSSERHQGCGHDHGHAQHGEEASRGVWRGALRLVLSAGRSTLERADAVLRPARGIDPIGRVSDGVRIGWKDVGRALLWLGIVYPAVLALPGWGCLRRRELAA